MAVLHGPKAVQYVTDNEGRRVGVLLDIRAWDALLEWIENAADVQLAVKALTELHEAGGPGNVGWVLWDTAREDWGPKELACQVQ
jgi:hypothetical protein